MTISAALDSDIFRTYVLIVGALLAFAGATLVVLTTIGKDVSSVWKTYRGWLVMVPLVLGTIFLGRIATIVGVALLAMVGFKEYARATGLYDDWWLTGIVYLGIVSLGVAASVTDPRLNLPGWYGLFMSLPVYVIAAIVLVPILRNRAKGQLQMVALAIVGFVYFGWMFSHLGFLANSKHAYGYVLYLIFAVEINDIAAFTCGKLFGKHKLRDNISPNKTIEGSIGAICVSLTVPWLLWFSFPHFVGWQLIVIGLLVGVGGQLGDLVISYIKRDIGIKDMGVVIKGHGGILDRVDSMIFVAPIFFHIVRWNHGMP
ncbi:MAG: phosphatidate cytidylyltransferase [Gammaproteobacteria bacterium]|nr:phosphatidate cytidylyltransferase [Gammaproteobacteria bacterium]MDH4315393.1 phosphatidate cytidylyltransferase [Gammaproteobacteria bacterium]MDH5214098.1 phosphatidate cytidylyltransferase [Gammaproteobacteria bacterium]